MCRKHQGRKCLYFCIISFGQLNPSYKQKRIIIFIPNPSYFLLTGKYFRKSFQLAFHNHKWSRMRGWHVFVNFFTWWLFLKGFCCFKIVYLSTNKSFADALHCKYVMSKKYFNIYMYLSICISYILTFILSYNVVWAKEKVVWLKKIIAKEFSCLQFAWAFILTDSI